MSNQPVPKTIAMVGPMGSGKTKIGRRLARDLDRPFIDTDQRIVAEHGEIAGIFERVGEAGFRAIEREVVAQALTEPAVVSLGGGSVLDADTRATLRDLPTIYLTVSERVVRGRLRGGKRPLVQNDPDAWLRIFTERRALYEEVASVRFDTSAGHITALGGKIAAWAKENS
ncbi:shikimate kinase [Mycetocola lacteus]|uniref:Shikimate kinase n=1 Tax=Mycetocola lacteus TaxID=76637 RepID=A0A3L7AQ42_9MICO|nr:shikimate kinase [Mycetocola lacteus]RLP82556.1 shikimate kinase [Mycetocola lacteus]